MKYLLDTHTLLWAVGNNSKISDKAKRLYLNPKNDIYVSSNSGDK